MKFDRQRVDRVLAAPIERGHVEGCPLHKAPRLLTCLVHVRHRRSILVDGKSCCHDCYYIMAIETKVRKIGNSLGIVLPKEVIGHLKVEDGALLHITEDADGAIRVTPDQPGFAEKSKIADSLMKRYRNALRELAK